MDRLTRWGIWLGLFALAFGLFLAVELGGDISLWLRRAILTLVFGGGALAAVALIGRIIQFLVDVESER
jgi:hypothetical protein